MLSPKKPGLKIVSESPLSIKGAEDGMIVLGKSFYSVGRHPECKIQILDLTVSRLHFTLFRALEVQPYVIADGNAGIVLPNTLNENTKSTTGTWVNGHRLQFPWILSHGALIKAGTVKLLYLEKNDEKDDSDPDPFDTLES